jgi:hypothetical protein
VRYEALRALHREELLSTPKEVADAVTKLFEVCFEEVMLACLNPTLPIGLEGRDFESRQKNAGKFSAGAKQLELLMREFLSRKPNAEST